jgi:hypothetical protein
MAKKLGYFRILAMDCWYCSHGYWMGFFCCFVALEQACAVEADGEWKESCMNKLKVWGHRSVVILGLIWHGGKEFIL